MSEETSKWITENILAPLVIIGLIVFTITQIKECSVRSNCLDNLKSVECLK